MVGRGYENGIWFTDQCSSVEDLLKNLPIIFHHHRRYDRRMNGEPGILFSGRLEDGRVQNPSVNKDPPSCEVLVSQSSRIYSGRT